MTRDPLTEALARELDAQDQEVEPHWEASGTGSADEFAAALFRPLEGPALERIEANVLEMTRQGRKSEVVPISAASTTKRRRAVAAAVLAPLALAAGLLLYVAVPSRSTLPVYQLDVTGGAQPLRNAPSAPAAHVSLAPGSQLEIVARPSTAVAEAVMARTFFVRGEDIHPWNPTMEISPEGAVRATAPPSSWANLTPGMWDLVVLIGRPDALPADTNAAKQWIADPDRHGVQMLRYSVEVLP
jgi:hypothetical protein